LNESGQVIGHLIFEVIPMTGRPRLGSMCRQVLLPALNLKLLRWLGLAAPAAAD
jgi:hypothetical protein